MTRVAQVTEKQREALIKAACDVRRHAYAPYSKYSVGAAVLTGDGRIFTGVNVENAVYGLGNCAERSAIFTAITAGARELAAVAVCTENLGSPCGACRQVISEFAGDIPIWLCDGKGNIRQTSLNGLLPDQFGRDKLPPIE